MVLIDLKLDTSISGLPGVRLGTLIGRRFHPRGRQYLEPISSIRLMLLIKRYVLFPSVFDLFYVVLGRDGMRLFDSSFLGQLLSMPMVVLSCQRTNILIFLHNHLIVRWVRIAGCR
jgi:hypothetical protein